MKNIYVIAGANGSGKTTFAREFLKYYVHCDNFINPDLIAAGFSPLAPEKAAVKSGRMVLLEIEQQSKQGKSFGFETTLSGKTYAKILDRLKKRGYELNLILLWVPSVQLCLKRIQNRVKDGGHLVKSTDVRRRYSRVIVNFFALYEKLMTTWIIFDNSTDRPIKIAEKVGREMRVYEKIKYQKICIEGGYHD